MTGPTLATERLTLRLPEAGDYPAYAAFYADPEASRFYGGPLRPDQAWKRLAQDIGHWQLRGYGLWTLVGRGEGRVLGGVGIFWAEGWPRRELTWWLLPAARGQGIATEASRAAIAWGYDALGWAPVETHMDDANTDARRLVVRLGGRVIAREAFPDGALRDVFALPHPGPRAEPAHG